jgi:hypothetical protein
MDKPTTEGRIVKTALIGGAIGFVLGGLLAFVPMFLFIRGLGSSPPWWKDAGICAIAFGMPFGLVSAIIGVIVGTLAGRRRG